MRNNMKYPKTRNYFPRPSLPDMQFEDVTQTARSSYTGTGIDEWNIDGLAEHQILNILQEMTMAALAHKSHDNTDHQIAKILVLGFTGMLKNWWDNDLPESHKHHILRATKKTRKVKVEGTNQVEYDQEEGDAVATLIYAITKNFVGDPTSFQEKSQ